jgi:hypothetical protein
MTGNKEAKKSDEETRAEQLQRPPRPKRRIFHVDFIDGNFLFSFASQSVGNRSLPLLRG